jgi:hypothetical protein
MNLLLPAFSLHSGIGFRPLRDDPLTKVEHRLAVLRPQGNRT